jgi:methionine aminopeptidase
VGGHASKQAERLVAANREALDLAIAACAPGVSLGHLAAGAFLPLPAT